MHFGLFIAVRQILHNKKKSIVLFLSVFVSLSLLIDMMGMYKSYKEMMLEDTIENYGAYHFYIKDVSEEECELLKKNGNIEGIGYEEYVDTVSVEKYDGQDCEAGQKIDMICMDRMGYELNSIRLRFGRLPENDREIIISAGIELNGGYAFKSDVKQREITFVNEEGKAYTYTIVGVCDDFNAAQGEGDYKAYTIGEQISEVNNVYVTVKQGSGYRDKISKLAAAMDIPDDIIKWDGNRIIDKSETLENYHLICNVSLLRQIEYGPADETSQAVIYIMQIIVIFILLVAAMVIWNIYSILVGERREEIGLLRVCGVSPKKILLTGLLESGILFGAALILSVILAGVGEFTVQQLIQFMRITELTGLEVTISYKLILLSALYVGIIVVAVVILTNVMLMKGVSPVELLNGGKEREVRRKRKLKKDSGLTTSASFLIGKRCLLRNKGKSFSIVLALAVVTLFFVTFSSFIEMLSNDEIVTDVTMITESQYVVFKDGREALSEEFIDSIPNTTEKYTTSSTMAEFNIAPELKNPKFKKYYNAFYYGYTADEIFDRDKWLLEVDGINKETYDKYVEWFDGEKLSYEEWVDSGKALIDDTIITTDKDGNKVKEHILNIDVSDTCLTYNDYDEDLGNGSRQTFTGGKTELCGRVGYKLYCREDNFVYLTILLPEDVVRKQFDAQSQILYINTKRGKETEVGVWLKEHSSYYDSLLDDVKKYAAAHDSNLTTKIMLRLAFLFVVIVSMLHIYNVVCSNLNARKKEMAILMAIGMKRWQIRKSVLWEHALYGIAGGILGAAVSAVLLERLLKLLSGAVKIKIVLPLDYMWIGLCSAVVVSMAVALYATRTVAKEGIVKEIGAND